MSIHRHGQRPPRPRPRQPTAAPHRWARIILGGVVFGVLGLIAGLGVFVGTRPVPGESPSDPGWAAPRAPTTLELSSGICRRLPAFTASNGFTDQGIEGRTSQPGFLGFVLFDRGRGQVFQHETWRTAGHLGPFAYDRDGNIFVGPVPRFSLATNPPDRQNTIWRIDTVTMEMTPYLRLDAAQPISERNPFGILGMTYVCDEHALYVSSVAGSTPSTAYGRIFRVDLATGTSRVVLDGVDAMGLVVANLPTGRRLFFGSARAPELWSVGLDAQGQAPETPRMDLDLTDLGGSAEDRVRKIDLAGMEMRVSLVPFAYTLQAGSTSQQREATLVYEAVSGRWAITRPATLPATHAP